jgi:hypothetical protein
VVSHVNVSNTTRKTTRKKTKRQVRYELCMRYAFHIV